MPLPRLRVRTLMLGVAAVAVLMTGVVLLTGGRGPLPLSRSPFLKGVVEPITIVEAMASADGGSLGMSFQHARGVVRSVCLDWSSFVDGSPDGLDHIMLGTFIPIKKKRAPYRGDEERALLGLLERWDARRVGPPGPNDEIAIAIVRELRQRN